MIAGRYELGREIGRGGMGAVWLGHDQLLGRQVALKKIGGTAASTNPDLERAEREARLAARLNHPHVVAVYDLVEDDDDLWLVMEYVEGVTLAALVKRDGALDPQEAAPLVQQAADALAAAHGAGIVHRDVKPSNMLVTRDGQVKLSDFGIARAEADASLTQTGLVTGSPAYLAPEVASGASATEASDVWSIGATLFHALAGHPPYDVRDNLMGALYRIVHEEPPRLANAGWLTPVLEHTMATEVDDRWSMTEVRDFLGQGDGVPIHPRPVFVDDQSTQVMQATPSEPFAVPPVSPDPDLPAPESLAPEPSTPRPDEPPPRRSPWPWVAVAVALVAVAVLAIALLTRGSGDQTAGGPGTSSSSRTPSSSQSSPSSPTTQTSPTSPETSPSSSSTAGVPTKASMARFIDGYLSTVTSDQKAAWSMLTPAFQQQSRGYGHYQGFWRTISSAKPSNIESNPKTLTVSYDVDYVRTNGTRTSDHTTLQLVPDGSSFLINGEG